MLGGIKFFKDGNMICAVYHDFYNLQESAAGFGENIKEAVGDLFNQTKEISEKGVEQW